MLQHYPLRRFPAAANASGLRRRTSQTVLTLAAAVVLTVGPLAQWWQLWMWVGATVFTAVLLTPPYGHAFGRRIDAFLPGKREWATYLVLLGTWCTVLTLLYWGWISR